MFLSAFVSVSIFFAWVILEPRALERVLQRVLFADFSTAAAALIDRPLS